MFERFTEKARRVVFFARYEASQYGSPYIGTEHLLLGLCREDHSIRAYLKDKEMDSAVRTEVERQIVRGKPFGTSVEVPLSADGQNALRFAAEEADRLGQRQIGTEHMLLGLLRLKDSLGARIARERGLHIDEFRERLAKTPQPVSFRKSTLLILEEFLAGLKSQSADCLMLFFAERAQVVDVHGKRWTYVELAENFDAVFAPYAKKNATYAIEETIVDTAECLVAAVLWENALVASMERVWMHRMTAVLISENADWRIVSLQVTPVQP
jgi:hypothetical protein